VTLFHCPAIALGIRCRPSATGLHTFLDEVRWVIETNHGVLLLAERMQVFTRADAAPQLREMIPEALGPSISPGATRISN
jgi:hypothetical protein